MRNFRTARLGGKDAAGPKGGDKRDGASGSGKEREEVDEDLRKVGRLRRMLADSMARKCVAQNGSIGRPEPVTRALVSYPPALRAFAAQPGHGMPFPCLPGAPLSHAAFSIFLLALCR